MNCKLIDIFRTFSGNRHLSHTGARFWEGLYTTKVRQNVFLLCFLKNTFFVILRRRFQLIFDDLSQPLIFPIIKLTFSHVQALFSSHLRCLETEKRR